MSACSRIRHIVHLRQLLKRWRKKAALSRKTLKTIPHDVPSGHVAVHVGPGCTRFVVRTSHLNHPVFRNLLVQAEEEYGFSGSGPLTIPCDEVVFEEIVRFLGRSDSARFINLEDFKRQCNLGRLDFWPDSRPLLHGSSDNSICLRRRLMEMANGVAPSYHWVVPGS